MKDTISSNRFTIDLTDESKTYLEKLKAQLQKPFGTIVNNIFRDVGNPPPEARKEMLTFYKRRLKDLHKEMDYASPFELDNIMRKAQYYENMASYLNDGQRISIDELNSEPDMVRYEIKDGYVIVPEDWIVANPEDAKHCSYAGAIECRRKDFNVPHFLFFTNLRARDYDKDFCDVINKKCCEKWPPFADILKQQVKPIDDPHHPGYQLNADEWMAAPIIGHFELYVKGEYGRSVKYEPPYGAMIVHTNKKGSDKNV